MSVAAIIAHAMSHTHQTKRWLLLGIISYARFHYAPVNRHNVSGSRRKGGTSQTDSSPSRNLIRIVKRGRNAVAV